MSSPVNPRTYVSPRREQQAQETRTAILDATSRLFLERGYVATRLADVAKEAGVSLATVKLAFGTKTELLLNLWHRTLAGGVDDRVPVAGREWARAAAEAVDPREKLRQTAKGSALIKPRIAPLLDIIETAAAADESLAAFWAGLTPEFYARQRAVVEDLERGGHLRPGLSVDDAADILWTLNGGKVYLSLVRDRGWSVERYEHWLSEALQRELLAPGS